ncbi:MAG: hypothetical protein D6710_04115 [Nitrospirae bacterium]|nr:MAG: hypothetical protein D6710_04115 [Nitrospirota bacterium]
MSQAQGRRGQEAGERGKAGAERGPSLHPDSAIPSFSMALSCACNMFFLAVLACLIFFGFVVL